MEPQGWAGPTQGCGLAQEVWEWEDAVEEQQPLTLWEEGCWDGKSRPPQGATPRRGTHLFTEQREIQAAHRWESGVQTLFHAALVTLKECGEAGAVVHDKGATLGALGRNAVGQVQGELRKAQLQSEGSHQT